jgi:hypothetical protein
MLRTYIISLFCCLICLPGSSRGQQASRAGAVQISSVRARPGNLSCRSVDAKVTVSVQVWIIGVPKSIQDQTMTVGLYQAWGLPVTNRVNVVVRRKEVRLKSSPATLEYIVTCGHDTVPGDVALTAWVEKVPIGVKINYANPPENGIVKIHINPQNAN